MTRFSWIVAACVFGFYAGLSIWVLPWAIQMAMPTDYFETINRIFIDDLRVGQKPKMVVDRVRHRNYRGAWDVYVRKVEDNGFETVCHGDDGDWPFEINSRLPDPLYLDRWMGIPPNPECAPLEVGTYYVLTEYSVPWILGATIRWSAQSNVFKVLPSEYPIPLLGESIEDESDDTPTYNR